jgi:3-dehydroquinate synthase
MPKFHIQDTEFEARLDITLAEGLTVKSVPYPYSIEFADPGPVRGHIEALVESSREPFVLIDRRIRDLYLADSSVLDRVPTLALDATEQIKTINSAIAAAEFLEDNKATKQGMYFVIGGGIIQDIGAFSAAIYKRGMPWTFMPTTLLAQGDSCVGGKTGLNHRNTKNLTALFSAPRRVLIDIGFLETLPHEEQLSGLGEAFRLCVTGGPEFLGAFETNLERWLAGDKQAVETIIAQSLSVKRAVVEVDEFEIDLRRSMNYGHSMGHALESLVDFRIPHGMAVTIGMLIENELSHARGLLSTAECDRMLLIGAKLVSAKAREELRMLDLSGIVELLHKDKKTLGSILKLVVVEKVGQIRFIDLPLDDQTTGIIRQAIATLLQAL